MKLDATSFAFGYSYKDESSPGTCNWNIALGQGTGHKININKSNDALLRAMTYSSIPVVKTSSRIGKGAPLREGSEENSPIISAALFKNVYVNDTKVNEGCFLLFIIKDESKSHKGRLKVSYSINNTYTNDEETISNSKFIDAVKEQFGLSDEACWFVTDINIIDQDILKLRAIFVDKQNAVQYENQDERKEKWAQLDADLRKHEYDMWLQSVGKDGKPFSPGVASNYLSILEREYKVFCQREDCPVKCFPSVYQIRDSIEFSKFADWAMSTQGFAEYDRDNCSHNTFGSSMLRYSEFLETISDEGTVPISKDEDELSKPNNVSKLIFNTGFNSKFDQNIIYFGAPGTGKSFRINTNVTKLLGFDNKDDYIRVTFHQDYSYSQFVGTYKPVTKKTHETSLSEEDNKIISILVDETKSSQEKYELLYESFKDDGLTRLPILLGILSDEPFETKKVDGTAASGNNDVERNHGKAIRKFVDFKNNKKGKEQISYEYVPGPFMRILAKAYNNIIESTNEDGSIRKDKIRPFVLVIEEINRAKAAAVFGDMFQLIDRDDDNISEYDTQPAAEIREWLAKECNVSADTFNSIKIPDNMFIWASMNSADQGVFPMDTAMKRRWTFDYIGINNDEFIQKSDGTLRESQGGTFSIADKDIEWNVLRRAINAKLVSNDIKVNEDKLMGPFFIKTMDKEGKLKVDNESFVKLFCDKVLMYLFEDAAKTKRQALFSGVSNQINLYSHICSEFRSKGILIFGDNFESEYYNTQKEERDSLLNSMK